MKTTKQSKNKQTKKCSERPIKGSQLLKYPCTIIKTEPRCTYYLAHRYGNPSETTST